MATNVGANTLSKLKSSLSNAGVSKVNFYNDEGSIENKILKKRPQSSKPPKFVTSFQGPAAFQRPQDTDWDSEYDNHMKQKTETQKDAIFNILDNQINRLCQGEIEDEDLGIQEINDDDESQDIFDNFEKN